MGIWQELISNQILVSAAAAWAAAQIVKTLIDLVLNRTFRPERLLGAGGMPSSHSATVCALTIAAALERGLSSFEFAISFVLALIVMHDAIGVRQETGKQAKLLNLIMEQDWFTINGQEVGKKLKELVGHTFVQVAAGGFLGAAVALLVDLAY